MDAAKAVADIANLQRQVHDTLVDKVKWTNKKEVELAGFKRREADYRRASAGNHFYLEDTIKRHMATSKKLEADLDKEIAKCDALLKHLVDEWGNLLVQCLPVGDIKARQLTDVAKAEMAREHKSTGNPLEKLEEQLASLQDTQKTYATDLSKLQKENEELRARSASYETQVTELATLKAQHEDMRAQLNAVHSTDSEVQTLKQDRETLKSQLSDLQVQFTAFVAQTKSQQAEFASSLERVRQPGPAAATVSTANTVAMQDFTTLKTQVNELDNQLNNFDIKEHSEAMAKLLDYPSWNVLESRIQERANNFQLRSELDGIKKTIADNKEASDQNYVGFSNKIIQTIGKLVGDAKSKAEQVGNRIKPLEERVDAVTLAIAKSPPPATSNGAINETRPTAELATGSTLSILQSDLAKLRNEVSAIKTNSNMAIAAHNTAIESLDDQFKNLTTTELAHSILEHLKKLPPTMISLDLQNFHERLTNLETFQQSQAKRDKALHNYGMSWVDKLEAPSKRSLAEDKAAGPQEKRQKMEGLNEVASGVVH